MICYLIRPCDTAVCITYLISHSSSLTYNLRIFQFGCIINTKLPSCDDIIRRSSLGFPSWCQLKALVLQTHASKLSCENLMMYGGLYQHTRVVLYIYQHIWYECQKSLSILLSFRIRQVNAFIKDKFLMQKLIVQ